MVAYDATERTVDDSYSDEPVNLHPPQHRKSRASLRASGQSRDVLESVDSSYFESASSEFSPSVHGDERRNSGQHLELAARESRHVWWSKVLVALVLVVSAGLLGYFTYSKMRQGEVDELEDQVSADIGGSLLDAFFWFTVTNSFVALVPRLRR
jgi:hypothetical protein